MGRRRDRTRKVSRHRRMKAMTATTPRVTAGSTPEEVDMGVGSERGRGESGREGRDQTDTSERLCHIADKPQTWEIQQTDK